MVGSCEYSDEPSSPIKSGEFPDQMSDYELLKKDPASCSWCGELQDASHYQVTADLRVES
jgi:hypothetical protein